MSRTVIDLDDDLLAEVAQVLGTTTKAETVAAALRGAGEPSGGPCPAG
ncbi:type II toxin-antitoxin system VapB family antitoxin [Streptomyces sp. 184]